MPHDSLPPRPILCKVLSRAEVRAIRVAYREGDDVVRLARRFGIRVSRVRDVGLCREGGDVTPPPGEALALRADSWGDVAWGAA